MVYSIFYHLLFRRNVQYHSFAVSTKKPVSGDDSQQSVRGGQTCRFPHCVSLPLRDDEAIRTLTYLTFRT
ncbi:hypothetical protein, partial [Prevotella sp. MGM2]|uniref:hypothetical protein n=1 Tax=Prevotella sp. MGM2 TaxID=2033406 RepID=UPI001CC030D5